MRYIFIFWLIVWVQNIQSQSLNSDSLIQVFLLKNNEVDTIIKNVIKDQNNTFIESNYYNIECLNIEKNKFLLKGYKFGSNTAHRQSYILIDIFINNYHKYFFFGNMNFEIDLKNLKSIFCMSKFSLNEKDKKNIITQITDIHIDKMMQIDCYQIESIL